MNTDKELVNRVARMFCSELRFTIGDYETDLAAGLNKIESDPIVCHSHDFCDANLVMDSAMRHCDIDMDHDQDIGMSQWTVNIWNSAWDVAKAAAFNADKIIGE